MSGVDREGGLLVDSTWIPGLTSFDFMEDIDCDEALQNH